MGTVATVLPGKQTLERAWFYGPRGSALHRPERTGEAACAVDKGPEGLGARQTWTHLP